LVLIWNSNLPGHLVCDQLNLKASPSMDGVQIFFKGHLTCLTCVAYLLKAELLLLKSPLLTSDDQSWIFVWMRLHIDLHNLPFLPILSWLCSFRSYVLKGLTQTQPTLSHSCE
jgi:hypothetical protein